MEGVCREAKRERAHMAGVRYSKIRGECTCALEFPEARRHQSELHEIGSIRCPTTEPCLFCQKIASIARLFPLQFRCSKEILSDGHTTSLHLGKVHRGTSKKFGTFLEVLIFPCFAVF